MGQTVTVSMSNKGTVFDLDTESVALGKMHYDTTKLPENEKSGTAKRLLGEAVLCCYFTTIAEAFKARNVEPESMTGSASVLADFNDVGKYLVQRIDIRVDIQLADEYAEVFEHVKRLMKKGCHISASIAPAICVEADIRRV